MSVTDVGVIATYRRQAIKIRSLLRERGLGAVRVGTVRIKILLCNLTVHLLPVETRASINPKA